MKQTLSLKKSLGLVMMALILSSQAYAADSILRSTVISVSLPGSKQIKKYTIEVSYKAGDSQFISARSATANPGEPCDQNETCTTTVTQSSGVQTITLKDERGNNIGSESLNPLLDSRFQKAADGSCNAEYPKNEAVLAVHADQFARFNIGTESNPAQIAVSVPFSGSTVFSSTGANTFAIDASSVKSARWFLNGDSGQATLVDPSAPVSNDEIDLDRL